MSRKLTPIVLALIVINVVVHLAALHLKNPQWQAFYENYFILAKSNMLGFRGEEFPDLFHPLQTLGASFAHGRLTITHLLVNMLCLGMLAPAVERALGPMRFLSFYLFSAVIGGFLVAFLDPSPNTVVGASGALCGLMVAIAVFFPTARLGLLFLPIFVPAKWFASIFALISVGLSIAIYLDYGPKLGLLEFISHFGHLAGMVAAAIWLLGFHLLKKRRGKHLTVLPRH